MFAKLDEIQSLPVQGIKEKLKKNTDKQIKNYKGQ